MKLANSITVWPALLLSVAAASFASTQDSADGQQKPNKAAKLVLTVDWPASGPMSHAKSLRVQLMNFGQGADEYDIVAARRGAKQVLELPVSPGQYEIRAWAFDQPGARGYVVGRGDRKFICTPGQTVEQKVVLEQDLRRLVAITIYGVHSPLKPGQNVQLKAFGRDALFTGTPIFLPNEQLSWSLKAGGDIASVSERGELSVNAGGTVMVEARIPGHEAVGSLKFNVIEPPGSAPDEPYLVFAERLGPGIFTASETGIPADPNAWHVVSSDRPLNAVTSGDGLNIFYHGFSPLTEKHFVATVDREGQNRKHLLTGSPRFLGANFDGSKLLILEDVSLQDGILPTLTRMDVESRKREVVTVFPVEDPQFSIGAMAWDGGDKLAYTIGKERQVSIYSLSSGTTKKLPVQARWIGFQEDGSLLVAVMSRAIETELKVFDQDGALLRSLHKGNFLPFPVVMLETDSFVFHEQDQSNDPVPYLYRDGKVTRLYDSSDLIVVAASRPQVHAKR